MNKTELVSKKSCLSAWPFSRCQPILSGQLHLGRPIGIWNRAGRKWMSLLFKTASLDVQFPRSFSRAIARCPQRSPSLLKSLVDLNGVSTIVRVLNSCDLIKQTVKSRGWTKLKARAPLLLSCNSLFAAWTVYRWELFPFRTISANLPSGRERSWEGRCSATDCLVQGFGNTVWRTTPTGDFSNRLATNPSLQHLVTLFHQMLSWAGALAWRFEILRGLVEDLCRTGYDSLWLGRNTSWGFTPCVYHHRTDWSLIGPLALT